MHELTAITPLGNGEPRRVTIGDVTIAEVVDIALASVACRAGKQDAFHSAASNLFGCALPGPGKSASANTYLLFWTAPDQWFVEAPFSSHEDVERIFKAALGDTASVTEQTDGWCRFNIKGPRPAKLFERLCALDTRAMKTGDATRTSIEHLGCFVICRKAGAQFSVLGPRSSAASLHHALVGAAQSIA